MKEKIMQQKFVPNDVYATQQSRFQIITGCNMSGKHGLLAPWNWLMRNRQEHVYSIDCPHVHHGSDRKLVRMLNPKPTVQMSHDASVPATYASVPIFHQLFARLGMDDSIETNVSTFAAEMREIAFILRNIDKRSL
jgi:DNA mismatch repair protein MSH4